MITPPSGPLTISPPNYVIDEDSIGVTVLMAFGELMWMATLRTSTAWRRPIYLMIDACDTQWSHVWDSHESIPDDPTEVAWRDHDYEVIDEDNVHRILAKGNPPSHGWDTGREDERQILQIFYELQRDFTKTITNLMTISLL